MNPFLLLRKSLTQQSLFCMQLDFLVYSLRVLSENALDARELRQIAGLLLLFHVLSCCERQAMLWSTLRTTDAV